MAKREFEYQDAKSAKFWHIDVKGKKHTVTFGSLGTKGASKTKTFDSPKDARKDVDRLIKAKTKKGYVELPAEAFEDVYMVSKKKDTVPTKEIDELEKAIGSLPRGYREFIQRYGGGSFCDDIHFQAPRGIIAEVAERREYMTFDACVPWCKALKGLKKSDFDDIWVIGGDGCGHDYCYFPRHEGVLFILTHSGMEVVRLDRAFCCSSLFYYHARIRHPKPYFSPNDRTRFQESYNMSTRQRQANASELLRSFFDSLHMEFVMAEVPLNSGVRDEGNRILFVPEIEGMITINCEETSMHPEVFGDIEVNKRHRQIAKKCINVLKKLEDE